MPTRPSSSETLTRTAARKAVRGVKKARSASAKKATTRAKKASAWSVNRYLGHFGVGSDTTNSSSSHPAKKVSAKKKTAAKKTFSAKKSSRIG